MIDLHEVRARIGDKYEIDANTGCWLWEGKKNRYGYGVVFGPKVDGRRKTLKVHRVMAALYCGLDFQDSSVYALHKCDTPRCINPEHLFLGDLAMNQEDKRRKGRARNGATGPLTNESPPLQS